MPSQPPPPSRSSLESAPDWLLNSADNEDVVDPKIRAIGKNAPSLKISEAKLKKFTVGNVKKTPFELKKEQEEAKKRRNEEEAARTLEEFKASFEEEKPIIGGLVAKTWVKKSDTNDSAPSLYKPQLKFGGLGSNAHEEDEKEKPPPRHIGGKKRQLDAFLEEIKGRETRQKTSATSSASRLDRTAEDWRAEGPLSSISYSSIAIQPTAAAPSATAKATTSSFDETTDPTTTNLFLGNLSPSMNEESLCLLFASFGPIASVKIMWPRNIEESERKRLTGFVSFMDRSSAEAAYIAMSGKEIDGFTMRIGWGKAISIPAKPIYSQAAVAGLPFNAEIRPVSVSQKPGITVSKIPTARPEIMVEIPNDRQTLALIHRTIERVAVHGPMFEALLMDREARNKQFLFLFQNDSLEHVYYRWKLFSILNGDSTKKWPTDAFKMFDECPIWVPPAISFDDDNVELDRDSDTTVDSDDSNPRPSGPKGSLLRLHRLRLEAKIRKLTLKRASIANAMLYCISHASAADEICDLLTSSLTQSSTPVFPTKVARLYLMSDVLHNSAAVSVPNAWRFRSELQKRLPAIFEHLGDVAGHIGARLRAEQMRKVVFGVVAVWERWMVFSKDFTEGLKNSYLERKAAVAAGGGTNSSGAGGDAGSGPNAASSRTGDHGSNDEDGDDVDGVPMDMDDDDVDGVPLKKAEDSVSKGDSTSRSGWKSLHSTSVTPTPTPAESEKKSGFVPIADVSSSTPAAKPSKWGALPATSTASSSSIGFTPISLAPPTRQTTVPTGPIPIVIVRPSDSPSYPPAQYPKPSQSYDGRPAQHPPSSSSQYMPPRGSGIRPPPPPGRPPPPPPRR